MMRSVEFLCRNATTSSRSGDLDEDAFRQFLRCFVDPKLGVYIGAIEGHALTRDELRRMYPIGVAACKGAIARVLAASALVAFFSCTVVAQQGYPNKPIWLISPNPPGGNTTLLGRLIAQKLTESWGQQVIVDNRAGGNGIIGGLALAKSPPDGYSIMIVTSTHIITPLLLATPYDPIKDFTPVGTLASTETILVIHPSVPAKNLQELIALARSRPGQLNYSSSGNGSPLHLAGELFDMVTGVRIQHIPYKGGGPAMNDLIGGQVQLSFQAPIAVIPHIKSGKLKAIAITGKNRSAVLPHVPTFAEAGLPDFTVVGGWFGILAPAATPAHIIDKLSTEIARILAAPDTRERIVAQGMDPFISTPDQFAALLTASTAKVAKIIKTANVKPD